MRGEGERGDGRGEGWREGGCKAFANMGRLRAGCDGRAGATGARWCDGHAEVRRAGATNATKMRRRTKLMR